MLVYLPPALLKAVKYVAVETATGASHVIAQAVADWLARTTGGQGSSEQSAVGLPIVRRSMTMDRRVGGLLSATDVNSCTGRPRRRLQLQPDPGTGLTPLRGGSGARYQCMPRCRSYRGACNSPGRALSRRAQPARRHQESRRERCATVAAAGRRGSPTPVGPRSGVELSVDLSTELGPGDAQCGDPPRQRLERHVALPALGRADVVAMQVGPLAEAFLRRRVTVALAEPAQDHAECSTGSRTGRASYGTALETARRTVVGHTGASADCTLSVHTL